MSAENVIQQIYEQLGAASANESVLEHSWMRVGTLLAVCKRDEEWRKAGFASLDDFMMHLRIKFNRGKTQLWSYLTVAEKLGPVIDAATLEEIGISKAMELKRALKKADGKPLPQEIIDAARKQETTIKEVRAAVAQHYNLAPDDKGTWFDLDGFFVTPDEKKEFVQAFVTTRTLLKIGKDVPEHIQRKEVILAWMREFYATHAAEVNGAVPQNTPAQLLEFKQALCL